jgi:NAD(P)H-hydrate epimerase
MNRLPVRRADAHKGDFGHALIVAGSRSMPGAAALATLGALRGGAGLVTVGTAASCHAIVAGANLSAMAASLPEDDEGRISRRAAAAVENLIRRATCLAIGPGLGQSRELSEWIRRLYLEVKLPMIVDADAINVLAEQPLDYARAAGPRILTPHIGEFRRLTGSTATQRTELELQASQFAAMTGATVLLKGHQSLASDGKHRYRNTTGHPAMATGGTGDVLTGLIAALICQGLPTWDAVCFGAHVHGLAGELAAAKIGPVGVLATDIADCIAAALQQANSARTSE